MDTKKVVVRVYGYNSIQYTGDIVVEAPHGMDEESICEIILSNYECIPEPQWREEDEEGLSMTDETPIVFDAESDDEPSVTLTAGKDGDIRISARKARDC